ncbi:aminoacyl-tRNA hydrolase [Glaciecola petra]|uniref:Peptidyl-tRNA hydrolase n=1 Tax=Glaciecola petra TaxID=3075602 RepID=A0ABU2ZN07_9ALTE|nr:aminoacyl-tRNA hydrolase [Aestuariibacter sp. P117]MDT0593995.1 aminoacyl-tRNA hydrolase [Aestuariibacter sp. P117]
MPNVRLIVGLGNPGPEYRFTRHNAGAQFVENLAERFGISLKLDAKFFGFTGRGNIAGKDVRLLIPTTFMNLSGKAVASMCQFYKIDKSELLVAFDELDFEPGVAKFKQGGSSSQNGIKDIVSRLANQRDFWRLRIGIGHPGHKNKVSAYVLSKAPKQDYENIESAIDEASRCLELLLTEGITSAQQRLHSFKAD